MHIHRALVDVDIVAPDAIEQLLAAEYRGPGAASGIRAGGTRSAPGDIAARRRRGGLAVEFEVAGLEHIGNQLRAGAAQQRPMRATSSGIENGFTT